eukprot:GHVU01175519.1.p1 GENE.GHVU01175519.1~~GHVU01175519.1.p1  ORF type:complete len:216 (-),score=27.90 GHVU01175519.1:82-729(-)
MVLPWVPRGLGRLAMTRWGSAAAAMVRAWGGSTGSSAAAQSLRGFALGASPRRVQPPFHSPRFCRPPSVLVPAVSRSHPILLEGYNVTGFYAARKFHVAEIAEALRASGYEVARLRVDPQEGMTVCVSSGGVGSSVESNGHAVFWGARRETEDKLMSLSRPFAVPFAASDHGHDPLESEEIPVEPQTNRTAMSEFRGDRLHLTQSEQQLSDMVVS